MRISDEDLAAARAFLGDPSVGVSVGPAGVVTLYPPCPIAEPLTVTLIPREDGGIRVSCEELPGLILSSRNVDGVMADILKAAAALRAYTTKTATT